MQTVTGPHVHTVVNFPASRCLELFKTHSVKLRRDPDKVCEAGEGQGAGEHAQGAELSVAVLAPPLSARLGEACRVPGSVFWRQEMI